MFNKLFSSLIICFLIGQVAFAQDHTTCGSIMAVETVKNRKPVENKVVVRPKSTFEIPLQIHIIRKSDGSGGIDEVLLTQALVEVNQYYAPAGVSFVTCQAINYIDDDNHYYFNELNEDEFSEPYELKQQINLFFAGNVTKDGNGICGYANFPGEFGQKNRTSNRVFVKNSCANSQVIAHELGHCLELLHTHDDVLLGPELVNGSNCLTKGDRCCDTPADPNLLTGVMGLGCVYTGTATDSLGDPYMPLTNNLMSYAGWNCQEEFTPDQLDWVINTLQTKKSHLACDGIYMTEYNCQDWDEPNDQAADAWGYFINPNSGEIVIDYVCLPVNDIDWYSLAFNGSTYFIKVEGVNNGFGAYTLHFTTDSLILTIETLERNMLDNDTKIYLYDEDMNLLTEDDNSGMDTYSKIVFDPNAPIPTSVNSLSTLKGIKLFPNPVNDILNIELQNKHEETTLSVYNTIGQLVLQQTNLDLKESIDMSALNSGVYTIFIHSTKGNFTQKIIK